MNDFLTVVAGLSTGFGVSLAIPDAPLWRRIVVTWLLLTAIMSMAYVVRGW